MKCDKCGEDVDSVFVRCSTCMLGTGAPEREKQVLRDLLEMYVDAMTTGTAAIKMELVDNGIEVKKVPLKDVTC